MKVSVLPQDLKIGAEDILLFNYRRSQDIKKAKIKLSMHTISFLKKGTKELMGNDFSVRIKPDSFVIMKKGNCLMTEKVSDLSQAYQSILLFFSDQMILDFLERNKALAIKNTQQKSFYVFSYDNYCSNFVASLEELLTLPKKLQQKVLNNKFEELMLFLVHQYSYGFLNELIAHSDDKLSRLINIVEENKYNRLSLEELAFLCNMSSSTFKRVFVKQYNSSPMKWFNEERLNHIAFLLKTKRKRPIDLYEDAGYENFSNFVQAFKKKFGMTPKQYQMQF